MGLRNTLTTPQIFISYRRSDAGGYAGQVLAALTDRYSDRAVTLDHISIEAGADFATTLEQALNETDVLIALIGPDWVTVERDGERRLHQEGDWVRREVATALQRPDVRVIPLLVGGAEIPAAEALPDDLVPLTGLQMREVRPDRFDDDMANVIDSIGGWRSRWKGIPVYAWLTAAALLAVLVVGGLILMQSDDNVAPTVAVDERVDVVAGEDVTVDILAWASDDATEDLALAVDLRSASDASISDNGDGTVVYKAPRGFSGTDSFGFRVVDDGGLETAGTVFVDVRPGPLEGAFNVVVPEFAAEGEDAELLARTLATRAFEETQATIASVTDLRVATAGPEVVGRIDGATQAERAEAVAALADQLNANMVLFGDVQSEDDVSRVALSLYISERGLTGATELSGTYELGTLEQLTSSPAAWELALAEFVDPRVRALGEMFIGLAHYQLNDYTEAQARFLKAAAEWPVDGGVSNGKETVLHLLGNVAGLQDQDGDAASRYEEALQIAPDYTRAEFGLAELRFQQFRGPRCGGIEPVDVAELEAAIAEFRDIEAAPAPPLSFLPERSQVEVARIMLCLTANGVDRAEDARRELETLIPFASSNPRLRNVTAEAHSSLAIYQQIRGDADAAIVEYRLAIDTTLDDNRRAFYHSAIGDILACLLEEPELAALEYAASDSLLNEPRPRSDCSVG